jgi:hypothetical protein
VLTLRLKTLVPVIVSAVLLAAFQPVSAQAADIVEARVTFDGEHFKVGDVLHMMVSLHNVSAKDVSIGLSV